MIIKTFDAKQPVCHVQFSIRLSPGVREVSVLGDFNGWTPAAHPLERTQGDLFTTVIPLPIGQRYQFKYLCDLGQWHNDEAADAYQSNEFGQFNSVLVTIAPGGITNYEPMSTPKLAKKATAAAPKKSAVKKTTEVKAPAKKAASTPAKKAVKKAAKKASPKKAKGEE